jgi:peptidoglycan/LPS O-acetylase OafA/YrhL
MSSLVTEEAPPAPPGGSHPGGNRRISPVRNSAAPHAEGRRAAARASGRRRYHELDLLRFVAALAVVLYHYTFRASVSDPVFAHTGFSDPLGIARYGYLGVDLFFVISGFVILNSTWNKRPSAFVASRIGRLYPAFWVACAVTALVLILDPNGRFQVTAAQFVTNLTMAPELFGVDPVDGVYWTLLVELKFYLLVLCLVMLGMTRNRVLGFSMAWLAVSMWHVVDPLPGYLAELLIPGWSGYFIAGILFSLIARDGWKLKYLAPLVVTYAWTLYLAVEFAQGWTTRYGPELSPVVVCAVMTGIFAVFTLICANKLQWRWTSRVAVLGALTYPLYLLHEYIGFVLFELGHGRVNRWVLLVGIVALMLAAAWLLHVTVEERCAAPVARWIRARWESVARRVLDLQPIQEAHGPQWTVPSMSVPTPSAPIMEPPTTGPTKLF